MTKVVGTYEALIGVTRTQPGNKVWHLESTECVAGHTALCRSEWLWSCPFGSYSGSARWKTDERMIKGDQTDFS